VDELDARIAELLEEDGRLSYSEIARRVHVSRAVVAERTQRLIQDGTVNVRAVVNPRVSGRGAIGYLRLRVSGSPAAVARELTEIPETVFVSTVTGAASVVVEIRSNSRAQLARCVERVRSTPGVRGSTRLEYSRIYKDAIAPVGEVIGDIDELDLRILAELETDGRMSYVELGRRIGISSPTARHRVATLVRKNAVNFGSMHGLLGRGQRILIEAGLRVNRPVHELVSEILNDQDVLFCGEVIGDHDLLLTLRANGAEGSAQALDRVSAIPGVVEIETWMHLKIWKEMYAATSREG